MVIILCFAVWKVVEFESGVHVAPCRSIANSGKKKWDSVALVQNDYIRKFDRKKRIRQLMGDVCNTYTLL